MNLVRQTLIIVFAMVILVGAAVFLILLKLNDIADRAERSAKEWYRVILVKEVDRLARDDREVQEEIRSLVNEMRSLVTEIHSAASDDLLDFAGHFERLDQMQEDLARRTPPSVVLPEV